jgi:hypothetical protein
MTLSRRLVLLAVVALVAGLGAELPAPDGATAQEPFPTRPITIWVGFPAGGGTDILTRALAEGLEKILILAAVALPLLGLLIYFRNELSEWLQRIWGSEKTRGDKALYPDGDYGSQ